MEWFTTLVTTNPWLAVTAMLVFVLGGIIHIASMAATRWGFFGDKTPDNGQLMQAIQLIGDNHLSHLPDSEKAIERIETKLGQMSDTLIRIETKLK